LRERVKGAWCQETVETVRQWVDNSRTRLELVLLDFGGKHARANDAMLERCSHFIAVAREFDDPAEERSEGLDSWVRVCRRNQLAPVALIRSCWQMGNAGVEPADRGGVLRASFRADACAPGDATNQPVIDGVVEALLALRRKRSQPPYVDLRLPNDWTVGDLADLGGLTAQLDALQGSGKPTVLGGRAPVWAYCAAMHRVLDSHPTALIEVFDPKVASGLVTIPAIQETTPESPLARSLTARWDRGSGLLDLRVTTADRMLPPTAFRFVASLPKPVGALLGRHHLAVGARRRGDPRRGGASPIAPARSALGPRAHRRAGDVGGSPGAGSGP